MSAFDNPALEVGSTARHADTFVTVNIDEPDGANSDMKSGAVKLQPLAAPAAPVTPDGPDGCLSRAIVRSRAAVVDVYRQHRLLISRVIKSILLAAYNAYLIGAILHAVGTGSGIDFCDGVGLLIVITALAYCGVLHYYVLKPWLGDACGRHIWTPLNAIGGKLWSKRIVRLGAGALAAAGAATYLILDTADDRSRVVSAFGALVFVALCWVCSHHPGKVIWRHVIWGLGLQLCFGLIILRWEVGKQTFKCIGDKVKTFLGFTNEGSTFVFGVLVSGDHFVFAFQILPVIIFFSFVIQILYYYGVMQRMIAQLGWLLQATVGTTACESVTAAANIFIGHTDAPLLIRPFLDKLTLSELHAVMTGGFATIAGGVLAAYASFGVPASHLMSASVMSAPAALAVSKLVYPETERSRTTASDITLEKGQEVNALDAAARGAMSVVKVCGYVAASLIAFIAFIAFVNGVLGWLGELVGFEELTGAALTFEYLASYVFRPVAWLMGAPWHECGLLGELLALKTILNEFVAYSRLKAMMAAGQLSARGTVIATYALCGFSNLGSMGIQISGIGSLAPERRSDLARLAFSAMMAGNVACFLTACIAGVLVSDTSELSAAVTTTAASSSALSGNTTMLTDNGTLLAENITSLMTTVTSL